MIRNLAILWLTATGVDAATMAADSRRGTHLFEALSCVSGQR